MLKPCPACHSPDALEAARAELRRLMDADPCLSANGIDPNTKPTDLVEWRKQMLSHQDASAFIAARRWLARFSKTKALNRTGTSYGLKHVAERDIGYVTNGTFIAAARAEGFRTVGWRNSPNALLNISAMAWRR